MPCRCLAQRGCATLQPTWAVGVDGGVSDSPEPMALRKRIMCRHRSHLPCSRAVLNRRVACCLLTAGTSMFYKNNQRQAFLLHGKWFGKYEQLCSSMISIPEKECSSISIGECLIVRTKRINRKYQARKSETNTPLVYHKEGFPKLSKKVKYLT